MSRRSANTTKVFVGRLPASATTDDLRRLFAPYGKIVECDIANNCGFLHLEDRELAMKAIQELDNTTLHGTRISVEKGRVKPPRNRGRDGGGPMRGGRDRGAPYSRDGFNRGPQRNGMGGGYGRDFPPYDNRYGEYDRGMPPRGGYVSDFRGAGDGRPPFEDRRGYRPYGGPPNGYGPGGPGGYDGGYDDRGAPPMGDRRPLMDQQGPGSRGSGGYDRGASNEMFSRREPKAGGPPTGGYGDRYGAPAAGYGNNAGYGAPPPANYGPANAGGPAGGYGVAGYAGAGGPPGGGYGDGRAPPPAAGYGDVKTAVTPGPAGYGDMRGGVAAGYNAAVPPAGGYGAGGGAATGYGDGYTRSGNYETSYPLPAQRSYPTTAGAPGGPGRRY